MQASGDKNIHEVPNLPSILARQDASSAYPTPSLATSMDDVLSDSHKKLIMELGALPTGSTDQAEAAIGQPRHMP